MRNLDSARLPDGQGIRNENTHSRITLLFPFLNSRIFKFSNFRIASLYLLIYSFTNLLILSASAQSTVIATLTVDSTHITIGDHLNVRLAVKHPKNVKVLMPSPKDSVGNMDFISSSKIDTIVQATDEVFAQKYVLSAYDSGSYHAGPIAVFYRNPTGGVDSVLSNDVAITVSTVAVDTTHPFKPIKAPLDVPYSWREFIPIIIGVVLFHILLIAAILIWLKFRKPTPVQQARPKPKDPPHIWARKELKKLEDEKLWQKDEVKQYYSRLTETLRLYLEFRYSWLALESTTEEIEDQIGNYKIKEKGKDSLLQTLRTADLVKFAKMVPSPDVNIRAMEYAYKFIDFTEPKEEEEK